MGIYFLSSIPLIKNRIFTFHLHLLKKIYNILLVLRTKSNENITIRYILN